jgi:hypothetical protein
LPSQIGELRNLTELNLYNNGLWELPRKIGELQNLTSLDLGKNSITHLPVTIGNLQNLTSLNLSYSRLIALPSQIGELRNLTSLNLSYNQLITLPKQIGESKNLTSLNLRHNQLTSLVSEIGNFINLTSLDLADNALETLPVEMGNLRYLTSLNLSNNKLVTLPIEIGKLNNLQELHLWGNDSINWGQASKGFAQLPQKVLFTIERQTAQVGILWVYVSEEQGFEVRRYANSKQLQYLKIENLLKSVVENKKFTFAKQVYEKIKDKKELSDIDYGSLSWYFVFAHCFEGAIWAGERYVEANKGKEKISALSNLAMGYLYNGNYAKAMAIYAKYKYEQDIEEEGWGDGLEGKEIFLEDLRAVSEAKVPAKKPADVEKMIRFLEE